MPPLHLMARPQGDVARADAFILLGFGYTSQPDGSMAPGASNLALARALLRWNSGRFPTITQQGTYLALQALLPGAEIDSWVYNQPHFSSRYVDTRGALIAAAELLQTQKRRRVCLITHPWQSARAAHIAAHLPFAEVIIPDYRQSEMTFDPASQQLWTRNRLNYALFEYCLARPLGLIFGWDNCQPFG